MLKKLLVAFAVLALLLFVFFNFVLEGLVKNKLEEMLSDTFGNYYALTFKSNFTSLTPAGFSIGFDQVELKSDTTDKEMMSKFAAIFFEAKTLEVNHISVTNLLFNADIDMGDFVLRDPHLVFLVNDDKRREKDISNASDNESKTGIKQIETSHFELKGGSAAFVFTSNLSDTLYAGRDMNVSIEDLDVVFDDEGIKPQNITIEQVKIDLNNVLYNPKTSTYKYQMSSMSIDYQAKTFISNDIDLIPKESLYQLSLKENYQKTVFDIAIGQLALNGVDFDSLKNDTSLRAKNGTLKNANFTLLRNANYPLDPSYKVLMNESLANSSFPIDLDTLTIQNAEIDYRLVPKGKVEEGKVSLKNINGYLAGLYSEDHKKDTLKLILESDFMANGSLLFQADFPLHGVPNHTYKGHISGLPFSDLNSIVTPMVNIELTEGMIEDIYFTGVCSNSINSGEMIFDYDNLKLQINNQKKDKKNWLLSDIGNLVVRHKSKKDKDGRSKSVSFSYERPPYQGHIGFYLNGLLDGMMKNLLPNAAYKAAVKGMVPKAD